MARRYQPRHKYDPHRMAILMLTLVLDAINAARRAES